MSEVETIDIAELPEGWYRGGSIGSPGMYIIGLDESVLFDGCASAVIRSKDLQSLKCNEFGTVFQNFFPRDYLCRRIKISAYLNYKLFGENSWTGIWMKEEFIDENYQSYFIKDNMSDRKLTGSSNNSWVPCTIVVDVPFSCVNLKFGFLLSGTGIVWANNFDLEVVDTSLPLTGVPPHILRQLESDQ